MESLSCGHTYVHARFWLTFWYHVIFFVSLTDNARLAKHGHQVLPGTIYLLHQVPPIHPGRCMLEVLSQTLHYRVTHLSATHTPSQTRRKLKFPFCKHVAESEQKKKRALKPIWYRSFHQHPEILSQREAKSGGSFFTYRQWLEVQFRGRVKGCVQDWLFPSHTHLQLP